jgi:hypothetical protein
MFAPGGAGTTPRTVFDNSFVLGATGFSQGRSFVSELAPALHFAPSRSRRVFLMYTKATSLSNLYIRNIIPDDTDIPLLEHLALSGWGEAVFPNYVEEEFSEVRDSKVPRIRVT